MIPIFDPSKSEDMNYFLKLFSKMSEPKFKRGYTVTILPRNLLKDKRWENTNVGGQAVVIASDVVTSKRDDYEDTILYRLWLMHDDDPCLDRECMWFEEKYLELYCSNELRGIKILEQCMPTCA